MSGIISVTSHAPSWRSRALRWLPTFVGFPLGAAAARSLVGPVANLPTALLGGLITGLVLGTIQSWGIGRGGPGALRWITATAVGLALGLGVGSAVVDYRTTTTDLLVQGAMSGAAVGIAQAIVLYRVIGRLAMVWPVLLAALWTLGWLVTASIGVEVVEQFTVFGSSGAIVVTAATIVLPVRVTAGSVAAA